MLQLEQSHEIARGLRLNADFYFLLIARACELGKDAPARLEFTTVETHEGVTLRVNFDGEPFCVAEMERRVSDKPHNVTFPRDALGRCSFPRKGIRKFSGMCPP